MEYKVLVGIVSGLPEMYNNFITFEEQSDLSSKLTALAKQGWRIRMITPTTIDTERSNAKVGVGDTLYTNAMALTILLEREKSINQMNKLDDSSTQ